MQVYLPKNCLLTVDVTGSSGTWPALRVLSVQHVYCVHTEFQTQLLVNGFTLKATPTYKLLFKQCM